MPKFQDVIQWYDSTGTLKNLDTELYNLNQSLLNAVVTTGAQTIEGVKTFTEAVQLKKGLVDNTNSIITNSNLVQTIVLGMENNAFSQTINSGITTFIKFQSTVIGNGVSITMKNATGHTIYVRGEVASGSAYPVSTSGRTVHTIEAGESKMLANLGGGQTTGLWSALICVTAFQPLLV